MNEDPDPIERNGDGEPLTERSLLIPSITITSENASRHVYSPTYITSLACALIVIYEMSLFLQFAPTTEIMESILCEDYYSQGSSEIVRPGDFNNEECKEAPIQTELALVLGWQPLFNSVAGLLTVIPYGIMADKLGRKPVLVLSIFGLTLAQAWIQIVCWWPHTFPLRWTWLSSTFLLCGGGIMVTTSMTFAILTDAVPEAQRTNSFFRLGAVGLLVEIFAPTAASAMMAKNAWLPMHIGLALLGLATLATFIFFPETANAANSINSEPDLVDIPTTDRIMESLWKLRNVFENARSLIIFMKQNWLVTTLVLTFLITPIARSTNRVLLQYVARKYRWTFSQASLLLSLRSGIDFLLAVAVIPALSFFLMSKLRLEARVKDLRLAQSSILLQTAGIFIIGFAANIELTIMGIGLFAIGYGFPFLARSLAVSYVEQHHIGTLYSAIALIEGVSDLISGPLLSAMLNKGLRIGGIWTGLPFIITGVALSVVALIALCCNVVK